MISQIDLTKVDEKFWSTPGEIITDVEYLSLIVLILNGKIE